MITPKAVEAMFSQMVAMPGVQGYIVINTDSGLIIRSSFHQQKTLHYIGLLHSFLIKTKATLHDMDQSNELRFIRIRSVTDEILIAPEREYTMIVIQQPKA